MEQQQQALREQIMAETDKHQRDILVRQIHSASEREELRRHFAQLDLQELIQRIVDEKDLKARKDLLKQIKDKQKRKDAARQAKEKDELDKLNAANEKKAQRKEQMQRITNIFPKKK